MLIFYRILLYNLLSNNSLIQTINQMIVSYSATDTILNEARAVRPVEFREVVLKPAKLGKLDSIIKKKRTGSPF